MCGISGIYRFDGKKIDEALIKSMNDKLVHRGPDAGQIYIHNNTALGHRRLSIIDLSSNANQPMFSSEGKFVMVFNGEVYNFKEIKVELLNLGYHFKSSSDSEVVLYAFMEWGNECFEKFNGMFALAILDVENNVMTLARDQFGIKPLYFYQNNDVFLFASEMKSILQYPGLQFSINNQALVEYLWYGNPMGCNTFYQEISELSAGSYITISTKSLFSQRRYFDINGIQEIKITEQEAVDQIKFLFRSSIKRHLISDVPVGVFLSGGIDSSAITGVASELDGGRLKTYSVGFDFVKGPNELAKAADVAKKFDTDHHELHIAGHDTIQTIEALVKAHDEPFGDAADIPLYLLTKELNGSVKVVLQGDGGDEFFGGYSRYHAMEKKSKYGLLKYGLPLLNGFGFESTKILRAQRFVNAISQKDKAVRNALLLTMESKYTNPLRSLTSKFRNRLAGYDPFKRYKEIYAEYRNDLDDTQAIFYSDAQVILKDTFFEKVDKSTMSNSIEVRVPFIDKELTEFMLSLPADQKVKSGNQKYLLKKAMNGIVPDDILYGKKTGFSVPYAFWLRSSLKLYFIDQINSSRVSSLIDVKEVQRMHDLHCKGKGNFGFLLWKILILAIWVNQNPQISLLND